MTSTRAQEILKAQDPIWGIKFNHGHEFNLNMTSRFCERGITPEEDTYIKMIWELIGSSASYYDALCKIAED